MTADDAQPARIHARFVSSAPGLASCPPPDAPEIAVAGRSNAGKSSVLNRLTDNRRLARTSKTPGRTQLLNFFDTDIGGRLVDLPGYGYAKVAKQRRAAWQVQVEDYLARRDALVGLLLVMDIRHPFQPFDAQMMHWAVRCELPSLLLLNKADKLKHGARVQALRAAERRLAAQPSTVLDVQLFSATGGLGTESAIAWLTQCFADARTAHPD